MGSTNNVIDVDVAESQLRQAENDLGEILDLFPRVFKDNIENLSSNARHSQASEMHKSFEALRDDLKSVFQWMCNELPGWHQSIKQNITVASQGTTGRACTVNVESSRSFSLEPDIRKAASSIGVYFDDALNTVTKFKNNCTGLTAYFNKLIGHYKEIHECTNNEGLRGVCASAASEIRSISESFKEKIDNFAKTFIDFVDETKELSGTAVETASERLSKLKAQFDQIDFETMEANVTLSQAHSQGYGDTYVEGSYWG